MVQVSCDDPVCFRLRQIANPPRLLFLLGNQSLLPLAAVAIVGTRRPSAYGLRAAMSFGAALARRGFCIVSGLASGIDAAAHRGALMAGGYTIAVVGHGLDRIYPSVNRGLALDIVHKQGCLVSEYPPGTPPLKHHFPERNRIIAGLSLGTVVIEAAERSGSLITARFALEQNREVFVVPSRYDDTAFRGGHELIQQGAKLVVHPDDIISEFPSPGVSWPEPTVSDLERLRAVFERHEGSLSLDQLFANYLNDWPILNSELEQALARGAVAEVMPQQFIWIANTR